jgi:putative flippase GtrA
MIKIIKKKITAKYSSKPLLFIFVGLINTIFGISIFPIIYYFSESLHYNFLVTLSTILAVTFSYSTHKVFVFKTKKNFINELKKYLPFQFLFYLINLVLINIGVGILKCNLLYTQIGITIGIAIISFFIYEKIVFSSK